MEPLKTLSPRSDHIVVAISKNLELLKVKELQGSLEAHAMSKGPIREIHYTQSRLELIQVEKYKVQVETTQSNIRGGGVGNCFSRWKEKWRNKGKYPSTPISSQENDDHIIKGKILSKVEIMQEVEVDSSMVAINMKVAIMEVFETQVWRLEIF